MSPLLLRVAIIAATVALFTVAGVSDKQPLTASFLDVPTEHASFRAIEYLKTKDIIRGYADGTFDPDGSINRAELTKIIVEATVDSSIIEQCPPGLLLFFDVDPQVWFYPYLCTAKGLALVSGYDDGTFRPENAINVAEGLTIIARAYRLPLEKSDIWYRPSLVALAERGALPTSIARLDAPLMRGQMAEIVYRLEADIRDLESHTAEVLEAAGLRPAAFGPSTADGAMMFTLVNAEREKNGLPAFRWSPLLEAAAQSHANDMVTRGYYGHISPEGINGEGRIRVTGYIQCPGCRKWTYRWGENLNEDVSAEDVLQQWMNSQIHHDNLLSYVDIGIARAGNYWVANFGTIVEY